VRRPTKSAPGPAGSALQSNMGLALVAVMIGLERAGFGQFEIFGLFARQHGQLGAELGQVQGGDLLVEMLGQDVDIIVVLLASVLGGKSSKETESPPPEAVSVPELISSLPDSCCLPPIQCQGEK